MRHESNASQAAPAGQSERYVFVYGTLRRGGSNDINLRKPAPRFVGRASIRGRLFDLGPYPGLILGSVDSSSSSVEGVVQVLGEVYAVLPALEENLDELEGLLPVPTGEYFKRFMPLDIVLPDTIASIHGPGSQRAVVCIVYEINPERTRSCALVPGGDWIAHCAEKTCAPARSVGEPAEIPQSKNIILQCEK